MGDAAELGDPGERVDVGDIDPSGAHEPADEAHQVHEAERELLTRLAVGAGVSIVGGAGAWAWGRRTGRRQVRDFGRQSAAWGVVDSTIAAIGRATAARAAASRPPAQHAGRLRTITAANAVVDVAYVAGGLRLVRTGRPGDGWAIVVQGLFLFVLDALSAKRFHDLRAPHRSI